MIKQDAISNTRDHLVIGMYPKLKSQRAKFWVRDWV